MSAAGNELAAAERDAANRAAVEAFCAAHELETDAGVIAHGFLGTSMQQSRQCDRTSDNFGHQHGMLRYRIKRPALARKTAALRQAIGDVNDVDLVGIRTEEIESATGAGEDPRHDDCSWPVLDLVWEINLSR